MSFENPTPLKVGARGAIHGWKVRVAGRVVLGVDVDGARYYWNEFNLVDDAGNGGTLVVEEGEAGPEWKLFQYLETPDPMPVREARRKKVGDTVLVGGRPTAVTAVGRSTVYHIEGEPPEGVERGDLADYLNADEGERMCVISWTGDEVEYYEGRDVPPATVAAAFGLSADAPAFRGARPAAGAGGGEMKWVLAALVVVLFFVVIALVVGAGGGSKSRSGRNRPEPAKVQPLPPPPALAAGARGTLGGAAFTLAGKGAVEVTRVSGKQERTEYRLDGENGEAALLVHGLAGAGRQWHLLRRVAPAEVPLASGFEGAAIKRGGLVRLGDRPLNVTDIFRLQTKASEGDAAGEGAWWPARVRYGFTASATGLWLLARWDEQEIAFFAGSPVAEAEVLAAFGPGPEKAR
jgi:hypothetical protein